MRFFIAAILGLVALTTAQSNATHATATATSTSTSLSPEATCLAACGSGDICCQARCVNVPCPNQSQANATTECSAKCPQGNGTPAETEQYAQCQAACVSSYFFSSGATAAATASSSGSSKPSSGAATTTTGTGSAIRTISGSASSTASATQNAAPEVRFGAAGVGLLALIAAGLAL